MTFKFVMLCDSEHLLMYSMYSVHDLYNIEHVVTDTRNLRSAKY